MIDLDEWKEQWQTERQVEEEVQSKKRISGKAHWMLKLALALSPFTSLNKLVVWSASLSTSIKCAFVGRSQLLMHHFGFQKAKDF